MADSDAVAVAFAFEEYGGGAYFEVEEGGAEFEVGAEFSGGEGFAAEFDFFFSFGLFPVDVLADHGVEVVSGEPFVPFGHGDLF